MSFNRTSMESKLVQILLRGCHPHLLIEPVWNRNFSKEFHCESIIRPFNRTSMESKHALRDWTYDAAAKLLIEPVWNRNLEEGGAGTH